MINYWTVNKQITAKWTMELEVSVAKIDAYFTFIQELLQIGKSTEVYELVSLPKPYQLRAAI